MSDQATSKRIGPPLGLIGALALVAAIEAGRDGRAIDRATKPALAWRFGAEAAGSAPEAIGAEVLCLGDSLVKLGVLPAVLRDRLGGSAFNLAVPGAQAPAAVALLKRALGAGARPRVVVVDFDENLLAVSPRENLEHWPEVLGIGDWLDLARRSGDLDLAARVGFGMLLPSWRDRRAIREGVVAALNGRERAILPELCALDRNWRSNAGAQVATPGERLPVEWPTPDDPVARPGRSWKPHPVNAAYVRRLCTLADRHGIAVAWLLPPSRPDWHARREALGLVGPFDRFIAEVRDAHPNLVVVDGRAAGFPAEAFRDPTHLDGLGAVALSEALAEALRPLLDDGPPPSRLLALRPYEPPASAVALEDMARSSALSGAEAIRRR